MEGIRLREKDITQIIVLFKKYYDSTQEHLWIFGSRVDATKRGGDIDLYIETQESNAQLANEQRQKFLHALYDALGDQKIDVVINMVESLYSELPIYKIAKKTGVMLV